MEDHDARKPDAQVGQTTDGLASIEANKKADKPENAKRKGNQRQGKKWSLRRHWDQAPWPKRIIWIAKGMGAIGGTILFVLGGLYYATEIASYFKSEQHYIDDHRPKVIFAKPPVMAESFGCEVTENAIHFHSGAMQIVVRNTSEHDAISTFVAPRVFKLVPNTKIGDAFYDDIPVTNDESCTIRPTPEMKMFPVHAKEWIQVNIKGMTGVLTLIKTRHASVGVGGAPQPEPQPEPGGTPQKRTPYYPNTDFQLYVPVCVYYSGRDERPYGTCRTYRFVVDGRSSDADQNTFSCSATPIQGHFEEAFSNYCEN